jgi:hypothetical protein
MLGLTWISIEGRSASPCRTSIKKTPTTRVGLVMGASKIRGFDPSPYHMLLRLAERRRGTATCLT